MEVHIHYLHLVHFTAQIGLLQYFSEVAYLCLSAASGDIFHYLHLYSCSGYLCHCLSHLLSHRKHNDAKRTAILGSAIIYFLEQILENIDIIGSAQSVVGSKHN